MKLHGSSFIFGTAVSVLLVSQPVWAQATTKITEVKLDQADGGVNLVLKTSDGSRPQVFTTKRGNALVADIINTQLRLPQGSSFRQDNPTDGIASVSIGQLDANSVRVVITGTSNAPESKPVERKQNGLTFALMPSSGMSTASEESQPIAVQPPQDNQIAQSAPVPNPDVNLEGAPAPPAGPGQSMNQAPPFLPRAVAPPVGDIAISNTDASPSVIDLGTQQRVPRLVLRDAPVREVLSLLARAANLNLAYTAGGKDGERQAEGDNAAADGPTISLDIENEPVQDVFNYVLRLSGLEANRSGRTIFVGTKLPNSTRDTVMRNMRLNQVTVGVALNFLVGLGAESAISRERLVTSVNAVPVGGGAEGSITETQTTTEVRIETQRVDYKDSNPLLRGLQVLGDERTNSVSLVGTPKQVEMAMAQLTQLDVRRRQVAVNVKIIDVNLLGTKNFNSSFSFGVADNFFSVDGGTANANAGGINPPTSAEFQNSRLTPTVTNAPFPEGAEVAPFFDAQPDAPFSESTGSPVPFEPDDPRFPNGRLPRPPFGTNTNPLQPGITEITEDGIEVGLPSLFQYPKKLLVSLQTQVTNGNAKVLTDPTLMVQEGQEAVVNLTAEVYGGIRTTASLREPIIKNAGLT
ncbi:MAG: AMIN domain-containing protein, partial [Rivularia sp. (in: cyanobacteria)]